MRSPAVVVAIPTLAADEALSECLDSLSRQTFRDFRIVVIDNSGCGLVNQRRGWDDIGAQVIGMRHNVGFGGAINAAWESSRGSRYLATLNDDAVAAPGWLAALVRAGEAWPEAGLFASRVCLADTGRIDSAGMLLCADGSSKQRGHGEKTSRYESADEVLMPSASAALYRGTMLDQIGGFDADFFLYCEDTDLGLRARRAGWKCVYVPEAEVAHRYSHSAGRVSALKAYYVERNRLFVAVKNFPWPMLVWVPFVAAARYFWHGVYLIRGTGAAAQFASESRAAWMLPFFVLKAHLAVLANLPRLLKQRRAIQGAARVPGAVFRSLLKANRVSARTLARY